MFVSDQDTIQYNIIILCISLERCGCSKTTVWRINTQRPRYLGCCCDDIVVERFSFETNQRNTIRLIKIRDMNVSNKSSDFFLLALYVFFYFFITNRVRRMYTHYAIIHKKKKNKTITTSKSLPLRRRDAIINKRLRATLYIIIILLYRFRQVSLHKRHTS